MNPTTPISKSEEQLIEQQFQQLLADYLATKHRKKVEIIEQAYQFALEAYRGVRRNSGEPFILHPIAVARIVCNEIGLGSTSICAALLHDVIGETLYTEEDIRQQFGEKIASITAELAKISGGIFGTHNMEQAEVMRKLLLTMSEDIRVVLVKMADRLHNMRSLEHLPQNKQHKIAGETLYIYAPLAYRLGLFTLKTELEELSFKYEHPQEYREIREKLIATKPQRDAVYESFAQPILERLHAARIDFEMKARVKSIYSIWNKMQKKQIPFEEVFDLYAVRIIFNPSSPESEKSECWNIYSIITDIYTLHPGRTRDWVNTPKSNGYQALHLTVMGPIGSWVEVQVRSKQMDIVAEQGLAAHWRYKLGEGGKEGELDHWLKTIQDILVSPEPNSIDLLDTIKLNLFASEIFVFTPSGEVITLPAHATALDFAFKLHSQMGYQCVAAKVNHKVVSPNYKLKSGDQVEIITSDKQEPRAEWMEFVTTVKAKAKLSAALRRARKRVQQQGLELLERHLTQHQMELTPPRVKRLLQHYRLERKEELLYEVGSGTIAPSELLQQLRSEENRRGLISKLISPFVKEGKRQGASTPLVAQLNIVATKGAGRMNQLLHTIASNSSVDVEAIQIDPQGDQWIGAIKVSTLHPSELDRVCKALNRMKQVVCVEIVR